MAHFGLRFSATVLIAGSALGGSSTAFGQNPYSSASGDREPNKINAVFVNFRTQGTTQPPSAAASVANDQPGQGVTVTAAQPPEDDSRKGGMLAPLELEPVNSPISAANIMVDQIGTHVIPEDSAAKTFNKPVAALPNGEDRALAYRTYRWQAANICHWPLYFEEPMLERHGVQRVPECLQPAVSGSKFLGNLVLLPYKATLQRPLESRYTLGHFRPGVTPPALRDSLPWSPRAAVVQGFAATGVVVGLPW